MAEPKFRPGPWDAIPHGDPFCWEIDDGERCISQGVWHEADARLIAAAPDLYAALNSAPVIRLTVDGPEPYEVFAERYKRWHREVKVPAERKARGEVSDG